MTESFKASHCSVALEFIAKASAARSVKALSSDSVSFSVNRKAILEEKLVHISGNSEKTLYHRVSGEPNFDSSLKGNQSLQFAFKDTRDNQLFLTNSVSQKIDAFKPVYDWFKDTLELIAPDSRFELFEQFLDEGHPLYATMNKMLS
jgi:hypothetical protein